MPGQLTIGFNPERTVSTIPLYVIVTTGLVLTRYCPGEWAGLQTSQHAAPAPEASITHMPRSAGIPP
eukprot:CAMPEP_0183476914 /NCGR_PEP_ID=MMETSP0370-20130417/167248_1 /TAXON_ID=268820 /ORGANISM="Peridinium aciculiferum, Strain PAER-2" /LENGTH=66 /DNA_ID=CAMNT_0025669791 /DNA_START=58 /DNA_END=255 /DNA_ORIENTATION=+